MKISLGCCYSQTNTQESSYGKNGSTLTPHPNLKSQEFYFRIHRLPTYLFNAQALICFGILLERLLRNCALIKP